MKIAEQMEPTFDRRLIFFLERKNITRSELARRVGVKPSAVTAWVTKGGNTPEFGNIVKIASALGVDLSTFFGPIEDEPAAAAE